MNIHYPLTILDNNIKSEYTKEFHLITHVATIMVLIYSVIHSNLSVSYFVPYHSILVLKGMKK